MDSAVENETVQEEAPFTGAQDVYGYFKKSGIKIALLKSVR